jgi:hypothetical protein
MNCHKSVRMATITLWMGILLLSACSTPVPPTATPAPIPPTSTPKPQIIPTPTEPEREAWAEVQCLDSQSLEEFLESFPEGTHANDARLYLSLFQRIADIQSGLQEPGFAIPFDALGERWEEWKQRLPERGATGYAATESQNAVSLSFTFRFPGCGGSMAFDSQGTPVSPTGDGSIVTFETHDLKFEYLNSILIESPGEETLYFAVVEGIGFVHLHGRGKVTMPDGSEIELN